MNDVLMFWKPRPGLDLQPPAIAQELAFGEEVDGLVDLPIKEIIDRLKGAFPQHRETPGLLALETGTGRCEATWSWQHVKLELAGVSDDERQRLIGVVEAFGCKAHEA
jgi:hypothetical protein